MRTFRPPAHCPETPETGIWSVFKLIALLLLPALGESQALSSTAILESSAQDPAYLAEAGHLSFLESHDRGLLFVDEISFRTETNRFDIQRQEYLLRANVNGFGEMRALRDRMQSRKNLASLGPREAFRQALRKRYLALIRYKLTLEEQALLGEQLNLVRQRITWLQRLLSNGQSESLHRWVEARRDSLELSIQAWEKDRTLKDALLELQALAPGNPIQEIDTTRWVSASEMLNLALSLQVNARTQPDLLEEGLRQESLEKDLALAKAERAQVLDFFQVRNAQRPDEPLRNELSLSLGLTLPYDGSFRNRSDRILAEIHESQTTQKIRTLQLEEKRLALTRTLSAAVEKDGFLAARLSEQVPDLSQAWRFTNDPASLEWILSLERSRLDLQEQRLQNREQIWEAYVEILDLCGQLDAGDRRNYLLSGFPSY